MSFSLPSLKQACNSKYCKRAAAILGVLLIALASFAGGMAVGIHKALFSAQWGHNYEKNFLEGPGEKGGRPPLGMGRMDNKGMRNAHGIAGEIVSVTSDSLIIKNKENQENTIRVNESTLVNRGKDTLTMSDLAVGQKVVVVGKPLEDGVIAAHLIRVFSDNQQ